MFNVNKKRIIREFIELVKINSETKREATIARVLKNKFQALGCHVIEDDSQSKTGHGAGNLICTLAGTLTNIDPVYFIAHMDTVMPGSGVKPRINNGYISSDGTTVLGADDKVGIVAMLEAIKALKEHQIAHGYIQFIITVGEESGLVGSKALDPSYLKASFGYALDSSGTVGDIVIAAPAHARILASISGKPAHLGISSQERVSATTIATQAISNMRLGRIDDETSASISSFEGGSNSVYDCVEILAEARSLEQEKLDVQLHNMRIAFMSAAHQLGGNADVTIELMYPSFSYQQNDPVVHIAQAAARSIGRKSRLLKSESGSDANIMASYDIPTVNLAVGYEHIHTTRERIAMSELVKVAELVTAIINQVAQYEKAL